MFHIRFDFAGGELDGERRRDFVEKGTAGWCASIEERHRTANLVGEFLVGEPGEILEHHGHHCGVLQLKIDGRALVLDGEAIIHA